MLILIVWPVRQWHIISWASSKVTYIFVLFIHDGMTFRPGDTWLAAAIHVWDGLRGKCVIVDIKSIYTHALNCWIPYVCSLNIQYGVFIGKENVWSLIEIKKIVWNSNCSRWDLCMKAYLTKESYIWSIYIIYDHCLVCFVYRVHLMRFTTCISFKFQTSKGFYMIDHRCI